MVKHIDTTLHTVAMYLPKAWPLLIVTVPVGAVPYMQLLLHLPRDPPDRQDTVSCHNNAVKHICHHKLSV